MFCLETCKDGTVLLAKNGVFGVEQNQYGTGDSMQFEEILNFESYRTSVSILNNGTINPNWQTKTHHHPLTTPKSANYFKLKSSSKIIIQ